MKNIDCKVAVIFCLGLSGFIHTFPGSILKHHRDAWKHNCSNLNAEVFAQKRPSWFYHKGRFRAKTLAFRFSRLYFFDAPNRNTVLITIVNSFERLNVICLDPGCSVCISFWCLMMTSWNGNIFRVTGHLYGEFTGPRWIPRTKASDAELWCFLWSVLNKRLSKQS